MNQRLALLSAILANPDDDLPRLVFADWLEENGSTDAEVARVEFIRLGCKSKAKSRITAAEGKWLDANWQRLLGNTLTERADELKPPAISRTGRVVRLRFVWKALNLAKLPELSFEYMRGFSRRVEYSHRESYFRFWEAVAKDEPLTYHRPERLPDTEIMPSSDPSGLAFPVSRLFPIT